MKKLLTSISAAILTTLLFGGCLSLRFGGGGRKTTTENKSQSYNVTLGQQLIDLQKAYDTGVISEREYKEQKKKLLRDYSRQ
jgi:hypothetical protein